MSSTAQPMFSHCLLRVLLWLIEIHITPVVLMGCEVAEYIYSLIEHGFYKELPCANAWHEFEIHFQHVLCVHLKFIYVSSLSFVRYLAVLSSWGALDSAGSDHHLELWVCGWDANSSCPSPSSTQIKRSLEPLRGFCWAFYLAVNRKYCF